MVYDTTNIRNNLSMTVNAVNGMLSATNEQEKVAWVTIYNNRMMMVSKELEEIINLLNDSHVEVAEEPKPVKKKK